MSEQPELFAVPPVAPPPRHACAFSPCRTYRYTLWCFWSDPGEDSRVPMFIGLNPSTADEFQLDPTLRRCRNFARGWGCAGFVMTNLFALRATDPRAMLAHPDPVGPENDRHLGEVAKVASMIVPCWGTHGGHRGRDQEVRRLLNGYPLYCLKTTRGGYPAHPLYLPRGLEPREFEDEQ